MKIKVGLCLVLVIAMTGIAAVNSEATTINYTSWAVTGIDDLSVGGETYDIRFYYGDFGTVFPNGPEFTSDTEATAVVVAMADALNSYDYGTDSRPHYTLSLEGDDGLWSDAYVPYVTPVETGTYTARLSHVSEQLAQYWASSPRSLTPTENRMFARVTSIPDLPAVWLLATAALVGLAGFRRKRFKK